MAEQVLRAELAQAGLADRVRVSSAGTGNWHVGKGAHRGTVRVLESAGLPTDHVARQIVATDLDDIDLVLAADRGHLRDLRRMSRSPDRVVLFRSFDPAADDGEIPDPYEGPDAGYEEVLDMIRAAVPGIISEIRRRLDESAT